jgi:hypothetical protein
MGVVPELNKIIAVDTQALHHSKFEHNGGFLKFVCIFIVWNKKKRPLQH